MLSNFIPRFNEITELVKKGATLEAQQKILELQGTVLEIQAENIVLKEKVLKLEESLKTHEKVSWESPSYWVVDGENKIGPFCQSCYDTNKLLIRLQGNGEGWWECKSCKNTYTDQGYSAYSSSFIVGSSNRSNSELFGF
jgi:ribosomal protein L37AE/L43A